MNKLSTKRTRPLPTLTLGRQIGKTFYTVQGEFSASASENISRKTRRLLLKEFEENGQKKA